MQAFDWARFSISILLVTESHCYGAAKGADGIVVFIGTADLGKWLEYFLSVCCLGVLFTQNRS